jgi:hypothetical protein
MQLLVGGFQQLDRSTTANRLHPEASVRVDMTAGRVSRGVARRVSENDNRELQTLGL